MHINPEFQRNIWLYVTLPRLLVFPVILTGSVYLLSLFEKLGPQLICSILFWTFIIITGALGANRVGSSTITEKDMASSAAYIYQSMVHGLGQTVWKHCFILVLGILVPGSFFNFSGPAIHRQF